MTDDVFPSKAGKNKYVVLLQGELFLTKAELNFLPKKEEASKTQQRYIRYKLRKKIKQFYDYDLPLLVDQGYIVRNVASITAT
jgi:hypothetical protein